MDKHWDIIGFGALAVDDILYLDHFPRPYEKMPVQKKQRQGGGLAATAMVAAARQHVRTAYCGRLGNDELSLYSIRELEHEGVDISTIQRSSGFRPFHSVILVDMSSASRAILYNREGVGEPDDTVVSEELIASSRFLFIDNNAYHSGIRAAEFAHAHGIPVIADIESTELPDLARFVSLIDHLIVGIDTARAMTHTGSTEGMARALANPQRAASVVTDGVNGCWYSEYGQAVHHFPAYRVDEVDTTGCGDVFHGTYAAALARGETVKRAIQIASASAALKATCCGGREGIPSLAQLEHFIVERGGSIT
jgi:sulfofructose kinase